MNIDERPLLFDCDGDRLVGIATLPEQPLDVGVVIVVGGPQYRAGSHRQFVLMSRAFAAARVASLRFDYRGMGDSEGDPRPFYSVEADIRAAVGALMREIPEIKRVVLWGLCDGASAALIAGRSLSSLAGIVALNPWVRSQATLGEALVKHYYARRILSREFWAKLLTGRLGILTATLEFLRHAATAMSHGRSHEQGADAESGAASFQQRMREGLERLRGPVLLILSENDLTAREFAAFVAADGDWKKTIERRSNVVTQQIAGADHTFSATAGREEVERLSCSFVLALRTQP